MPCTLEVIDTRVQSTSLIQCNRSFDRNIGSHFSKGHLIRKPISVHPENRDTALTILPLGHDSDWKSAPFLSDIQEVNKWGSPDLTHLVPDLTLQAASDDAHISDPHSLCHQYKSLELRLCDLHPASWCCVAWYPIYRIPDGKLQAAFLTYHSLGHWISRSSSADEAVVLPVVGLQSYNDKAERWFEMSKSDSEDGEPAELQCGEASHPRF